METLQSFGGDEQNLNGSGRKALWEVLRRKYPKCSPSVPVGEKDKFGNIVTNHEGLKNLYLKTYLHRLRNRPIKEEYEEMKKFKDELFDIRLKLASSNKSNGWFRNLFSNEVAGKHLKLSMLMLFNKVKLENYFPDFIRLADVATIYKGKGEKIRFGK